MTDSCITFVWWQINQIILEGITVPDAENDLRKQQLRELALLNGTLRENDALTYDALYFTVSYLAIPYFPGEPPIVYSLLRPYWIWPIACH